MGDGLEGWGWGCKGGSWVVGVGDGLEGWGCKGAGWVVGVGWGCKGGGRVGGVGVGL